MRTVKAPGARQALTTSLRCRAIRRPGLSARELSLQRIRAGQIRWNAIFVPTAGGAIDHSFSS
jgi:hypothetical protein